MERKRNCKEEKGRKKTWERKEIKKGKGRRKQEKAKKGK